MNKYRVVTGIVSVNIEALNERLAIETLKTMIRAREQQHYNPIISMSLVPALKEGRLNFIVFDADRTSILAGELNGNFQQPVTRELCDTFRAMIPDALYYQVPAAHCPCGCR